MIKDVNELNNEGILTDEQVDEIVNVLESERKPVVVTPDIDVNEKVELIEAEADVKIDPRTGTCVVINENDNELKDKKISDKSISELSSETFNEQEYMQDFLDLSVEDAMMLSNTINRYKAGEKFSIYNNLPESLKTMVKNVAGSHNVSLLQQAAEGVLETIVDELENNKEYINMQESFQKELGEVMHDMSDMYNNVLQEKRSKLEESIEQLKAEGKYETAERFEELVEAYDDSHSLKRQLDALDNMPGIRKALKRATKAGYLDKAIDYFNFKYKTRKNNKLIIRDISNLPLILLRVLNNHVEDRSFTMDEVYQYVMLLCEVCKNYEPDNPVEHQFMYYSVNNIIALDYVEMEKSEFNKELIKNIVKVIDKIHEVVKEN